VGQCEFGGLHLIYAVLGSDHPIQFNDIDVATCWVIGRDTTCPYLKNTSTNNRQVIVPVVAAILVFVISGLTLFVKCKCLAKTQSQKCARTDALLQVQQTGRARKGGE